MSFYLPSSRNCVHQNSAERQEHFEVIYFSFDKFYNESYSWCSIWIIVSDREDVLLTTPADRLNPTPGADTSLPTPQILCRHSQPPQLCGVSSSSSRMCLPGDARYRKWTKNKPAQHQNPAGLEPSHQCCSPGREKVQSPALQLLAWASSAQLCRCCSSPGRSGPAAVGWLCLPWIAALVNCFSS